ncbi:FAD-dependent oxidoreductase [Streptomyces sp. R302]|nr:MULTISPECIES: NAD(P)/FAD-dependent oxidoreductase [unclassified Streptomyces]NML54686.1 FAD-dependent oxidoreductase [Streptomyces sp. R301]NML82517.1 FAD-dependent oxidoreductase [Streptomyces sp. R302]
MSTTPLHPAAVTVPLPRPGPSPRRRPCAGGTVTVVGAGMAGLVAAYELERRGFRVEVLEGSLRLGGRVRTHRFGAQEGAPFVELGAMRIPTAHHRTMGYVAHLGLADQVRPFRTLLSEENAFLATGGGHVRLRDAPRALVSEVRSSLGPAGFREETVVFGAWLAAVVDAVAPPALRDGLRADLGGRLLGLVDEIDLTPHLRGGGKDRIDVHGLFAAHPGIRAGCGSRLDGFLDDILTETSPRLVQLACGMDQLVQRLAARIRGPIWLGQPATGFEVAADHVQVRLGGGAGARVRRCDYVLCTVPFSVLRGLRLAGFDEDKLAAVREVVYCPATKVAVHCREPFWEREGIRGGASFSGGRIRQTYYPTAEPAGAEGAAEPSLGAALLASYTIGEDADVLGGMPAPVRHRAVVEELGRMHPQLLRRGMVRGVASLAWGGHPWTRGGCTIRWGADPAGREEQRLRALRPQGRMFFAGEHCATEPAWIEGAVESALEAVELIARDEGRCGGPSRDGWWRGAPAPAGREAA